MKNKKFNIGILLTLFGIVFTYFVLDTKPWETIGGGIIGVGMGLIVYGWVDMK